LGLFLPITRGSANGWNRRILAIGTCVRLGPLFDPKPTLVAAVLAERSCPFADLHDNTAQAAGSGEPVIYRHELPEHVARWIAAGEVCISSDR
jgi:hypothetical protein